MAYNYLELVNQVNRRLNEVELTSSNFSTAVGFYAQAKDAINASLRDINQHEFNWPFNHVEQEDVLSANVTRYAFPHDAKLVDFDSFRIKEDSSLGLSLNKIQIAKFVDFLKSANNKFKEWDKVAKENAVQELRKEYKKSSFRGYFKYAKWKFGTATLSAKYSISKGKASRFIYIPSFESSSNQFIKSKSHLFYITDELIKEMENYLSDEAINTFVKSKTSADDLFKNDS